MTKEKEQAITIEKKKVPERLAWPEDMDRFFDRMMRTFAIQPWRPMMRRRFFPFTQRMEEWVPDIDILEKNGNMVIQADLPGMKREDIEVAVEGDMLVIKGQRKEEKEVKKEDYYCTERAVGEFYRAFSLPEGVDAEAIRATYKDGVLEVTMPRPVAAEAKKVEVPVK